MNDLDLLDLLVEAVRASTSTQILAGSLSIELDAEALDHFVTRLDDADILYEVQENSLCVGAPPNFYQDLSLFLQSPERRLVHQSTFYIKDIDFYCKDKVTKGGDNDLVDAARDAAKLFSLMDKVKDHDENLANDKKLIFFSTRKFSLKSDFGADDLENFTGREFLMDFSKQFVDSAEHKEKKHEIIKVVLSDRFRDKTEVCLKDLMECFSEFYADVYNSFQLFVGDFSFQKIKSEVEHEKLEFTSRLNKVFSDVQNQLLAIPAALLLVGGQMSPPDAHAQYLLKNTAIWLGVFVFAILMQLLIKNQRSTLQAIKNEMDLQKIYFERHKENVVSLFNDAYVDLYVRFSHQVVLLWVVSALVALSFGFTSGLLVSYSFSFSNQNSMLFGLCAGILVFFLPLLAKVVMSYVDDAYSRR